MLTPTASTEEKSKLLTSSRAIQPRATQYLVISCIYLVIIVIIQFVVIHNINWRLDQAQKEFGTSLVCQTGVARIVKRQAGQGWWQWNGPGLAEGQFCPSGCVRRRRRKGSGMSVTPRQEVSRERISWNYDGYSGSAGQPGGAGQPGMRGSPGQPGGRGAPGSPGQPGNSGAPGQSGYSGSPGRSGSPGQAGEVGYSGSRGSSGIQGPPGQRGPPGQSGYSYGQNNYYDLRSGSSRGDQRSEDLPALRNQTNASELLREFQLHAHPECKDDVNHQAMMHQLKDTGKVSFMILIDLQDNKYCILHA